MKTTDFQSLIILIFSKAKYIEKKDYSIFLNTISTADITIYVFQDIFPIGSLIVVNLKNLAI